VKDELLEFQQETSPKTMVGAVVPHPDGAVVHAALAIAPDELDDAEPLPTRTAVPPGHPLIALQVPPETLNAHISKTPLELAGYPEPPAPMEGVPHVPPVSVHVAVAPSPPSGTTATVGAVVRPYPL
jgi:hypothetical protein